MIIYPLTFIPILKERIWGGYNLHKFLDKAESPKKIGESWELSSVKNDISIVADGIYKNRLLTELLSDFPKEILGGKVFESFGAQFPLLFKFLDASEDLSVQVHPHDELALKRHNSLGKTEMWFIIQAEKGSRNIIGFDKESSPEEYLDKLNNKDLLSILKTEPVQKGDVFFLETGTVHAIGSGIVLAEIQQTSDITYRIYDWDRVDSNGQPRELHLDWALDAINYNPSQTRKTYSKTENQSNPIIQSQYFITNYIALNGSYSVKKNSDSFRVYMCCEGTFSIYYQGKHYSFGRGTTVLLPAVMNEYLLEGKATLLEVYL